MPDPHVWDRCHVAPYTQHTMIIVIFVYVVCRYMNRMVPSVAAHELFDSPADSSRGSGERLGWWVPVIQANTRLQPDNPISTIQERFICDKDCREGNVFSSRLGSSTAPLLSCHWCNIPSINFQLAATNVYLELR